MPVHVTSVDFLVTDGAVPVTRGTQIMERWRNHAHSGLGRSRLVRQIGMALKAHETNFVPGEHAWIRRAVGLVTTRAALEAHGRVLEREGSALLPVTTEAPRLIGREGSHHPGTKASVGIVAVHAGHRTFWDGVFKGLLKLAPGTRMTAGALRIDGCPLACNEPGGALAVNRMARGAGHLTPGMAALYSSSVSRLVQMTFEAGLVDFDSRELGRIPDLFGRAGLGMHAPGPVTGLASLAFEAAFLIGFHDAVRALLDCVEQIFVACLAYLRPNVSPSLVLFRFRLGCLLRVALPHPEQNHVTGERKEAHWAAVIARVLDQPRTLRSIRGTPRSFRRAESC